jgi:ribonucleotide monophosphatase NagD (HAD superfamily)
MEGIRGLLIDIDGVLVVSWQARSRAHAEAVAHSRASRPASSLRLLTNTTSIIPSSRSPGA